MIHPDTLTPTWLSETAARLKQCDPNLLEKSIRALILVEQLSKSGLPFLFKGGSALMLYRPVPLRFSIDIDIILPRTTKEELTPYLEKIAPATESNLSDWPGFTHHAWDSRGDAGLMNKGHVKFFYQPLTAGQGNQAYILLDILYEDNPYAQLSPREVRSELIQYDATQICRIDVPSIDDLLGDKLTAFAPNTTGIPYGIGKELEIIKQLFDVGMLFDEAQDLDTIRATFDNIAREQLRYRGLTRLSTQDVYQDIIQTALHLCTRGKQGLGDIEELQRGIKSFQHHTWQERFHIEKAIRAGAKAAYLIAAMLNEEKAIQRYAYPQEVDELLIEVPNANRLNKLKKTNPEAFFYWCHAFRL